MFLKSKSTGNEYTDSVRMVRDARILNICVCSLAMLALVGVSIYALSTDYTLLVCSACVCALVPLAALLVKTITELRAVSDIAYRGVFAARLTRSQQSEMRRNLVRQGQSFYLAFFLCLCTPECVLLVILSAVKQSATFLMIMAVFTLAALACAFVASLYLAARLNVKHAFCTVSSRGIITSKEVIPFDARRGEVYMLIRYNDYYMIQYKRTELFGIKRTAVYIFPTDGIVKNGIDEDPAVLLSRTFGLRSYKSKAVPFEEKREFYYRTKDKPLKAVGAAAQ